VVRFVPRRLREIFLLVAATAVGLLLVEVGLRIHYAFRRPGMLADLALDRSLPPRGAAVGLAELIRPSPHSRLVFELRPNLVVRFRGAAVRTNSRGWRDREFEIAKPAGTMRIVGIGDSIMFGWAVEEEERYTSRLEAMLEKSYPERSWEVLTLASPGYNLVMEVEALERYGLDYEPDLILYGYTANDRCLPNFVAEGADVYGRELFVMRYLTGPRLVARESVVSEQPRGAGFSDQFCSTSSVALEYRPLVGDENFRGALEGLEALGRERDVSVVLVSHPGPRELPWPDVPAGIEVVHATGQDGASGPGWLPLELRISRDDPHPNAAGHAMIATNVFDALARRGIWDRLIETAHRDSGG
jgi:lysophospholipase L1-like esterase